MTEEEIKFNIASLNEENQRIITQGFFTLNDTINRNNSKIKYYQSQCAHKFINGKCEICDYKEN